MTETMHGMRQRRHKELADAAKRQDRWRKKRAAELAAAKAGTRPGSPSLRRKWRG